MFDMVCICDVSRAGMDSEKVTEVLNKDLLESLRNLVKFQGDQVIFASVNDPAEVKKVFENFGKLLATIIEWMVESEDFAEVRSSNPKAFEKLRTAKEKIKFNFKDKEVHNLQKAIKDVSELYNTSIREGLFSLPSIKKGIKVDEVLEEVQEKGSLLSYYNDYFRIEENIKLTLSEWLKSDFFKGPRGAIISDAMEAHRDRKFTLSIPVFLIHIEAFFSGIFGELNWDTKRKRNALMKLLSEEAEKNNISKYFSNSSFLLHIINDVMRKIEKNENTNFPNRHKILHGERLTYFEDESNSTKCIILLDAITKINVNDYKEKLSLATKN